MLDYAHNHPIVFLMLCLIAFFAIRATSNYRKAAEITDRYGSSGMDGDPHYRETVEAIEGLRGHSERGDSTIDEIRAVVRKMVRIEQRFPNTFHHTPEWQALCARMQVLSAQVNSEIERGARCVH